MILFLALLAVMPTHADEPQDACRASGRVAAWKRYKVLRRELRSLENDLLLLARIRRSLSADETASFAAYAAGGLDALPRLLAVKLALLEEEHSDVVCQYPSEKRAHYGFVERRASGLERPGEGEARESPHFCSRARWHNEFSPVLSEHDFTVQLRRGAFYAVLGRRWGTVARWSRINLVDGWLDAYLEGAPGKRHWFRIEGGRPPSVAEFTERYLEDACGKPAGAGAGASAATASRPAPLEARDSDGSNGLAPLHPAAAASS